MIPWSLQVLAGFVLVLITFVVIRLAQKLHPSKSWPPLYGGRVAWPWLGCALEFGKSPLTFIESKRKELGPVFTLKVAGERMTFLTDSRDFHHFFHSPDSADFQAAVQSSVQNIGDVSKDDFFRNHTKIHDAVKGYLTPTNLAPLSQGLHQLFQNYLWKLFDRNEKKHSTKVDLLEVVRSSMYKSVIINLFGQGTVIKDDKESFLEVEKQLLAFDENVEYGAKLPLVFLKDFASARNWLLSHFTQVIAHIKKDSSHHTVDTSNSVKVQESTSHSSANHQNLLHVLLSVCEPSCAPNFSLLLLWASLANAIPMTFWTLTKIYSQTQVLAKVRAEIAAVMKTEETAVTEPMLDQLSYSRKCVLESIRLHSPGIITRRLLKEVKIQSFQVPAGDLLLVSPYWAHRNPELFPEPETFKPERWDELDKHSLIEGFIAFGGGRYICPGRWFALMEIQMYVIMFVRLFDCQMVNGVPDVCTDHLVGTQQPVHKCPVVLTNYKSQPSAF